MATGAHEALHAWKPKTKGDSCVSLCLLIWSHLFYLVQFTRYLKCMQTGADSYFCTASLVDPICEEHGLRRSMHYKMLQGWTWKRKTWGMRGCNKQLPNATMVQLLRAWNLLCRLAVTQVNTVLCWILDLSSNRQVLLSQEFKTLNASKCHVTQLYAVQLLRKNKRPYINESTYNLNKNWNQLSDF